MPGKSPAEAVSKYVATLQLAVSCVTRAVLRPESDIRTSEPVVLTFIPATTVSIRTDTEPCGLAIIQYFTLEERAEAPRNERWYVRTAGYNYAFENKRGQEFIAYHWHPEQQTDFPHLHIGPAFSPPVVLRKAHLPCGDRVTLEDFLTMLVESFHVRTIRSDWRRVLDQTRREYLAHRRPLAYG